MFYKCNLCEMKVQGMFPMFEHLEEEHNIEDETEMENNCSLLNDAEQDHNSHATSQVTVDSSEVTPPRTPPPVSTIQLVPAADSPDSGAISDDDDDDTEEFDVGPAPPSSDDQSDKSDKESNELVAPSIESRSSSPFTVTTIEELKEAMARDGDCKFLVSEDLVNSEGYRTYMDQLQIDQVEGEESSTFNLKKDSEIIGDKEGNMKHFAEKINKKDMEIGNVSPEVEDKYFPVEIEEQDNESIEKENNEKYTTITSLSSELRAIRKPPKEYFDLNSKPKFKM